MQVSEIFPTIFFEKLKKNSKKEGLLKTSKESKIIIYKKLPGTDPREFLSEIFVMYFPLLPQEADGFEETKEVWLSGSVSYIR